MKAHFTFNHMLVERKKIGIERVVAIEAGRFVVVVASYPNGMLSL